MNFDAGDVTSVMNHREVSKAIYKLMDKLDRIEKAITKVDDKLTRAAMNSLKEVES